MCPTCSHTMKALATGVFYCWRCGTIKTGDQPHEIEAPNLVKRCVALCKKIVEHGREERPVPDDVWSEVIAIEEACMQPYERKLLL